MVKSRLHHKTEDPSKYLDSDATYKTRKLPFIDPKKEGCAIGIKDRVSQRISNSLFVVLQLSQV